jgi:hypothetical protein
MKNPNVHRLYIRQSFLPGLIAFAGCLLFCASLALAQAPSNQLHFAFADAPGGTTTTSDTALNPSAIVTTLTMYNALSPAVAVDLHGAAGSGVTNIGLASVSRAIDFTAAIVPTQTNQPANSKASWLRTAAPRPGPILPAAAATRRWPLIWLTLPSWASEPAEPSVPLWQQLGLTWLRRYPLA